MESKNKAENKSDVRLTMLDATLEELKQLKEIELKNIIEINEIKERIHSFQLAQDIKKKNKIDKKEDKEVFEDSLLKLKEMTKEIEFRNKEINNEIKLKQEKIELLKKKQKEELESLKNWTWEVRKTTQDMKRKSEEFKQQWADRSSKLSEMYAYINSEASKKDKKVAQIKVYLTEYELKVLENLASQSGSDKSSVMRDLLKKQDYISSAPAKQDQNIDSPYVMKVFQPEKFEDIHEYVNLLDRGDSIIVNFDLIREIEPNISQRCIDFLSGAVFRSGGKITEIGSSSIVCTTDKSNVVVEELIKKIK